jgi:hypothetical protein
MAELISDLDSGKRYYLEAIFRINSELPRSVFKNKRVRYTQIIQKITKCKSIFSDNPTVRSISDHKEMEVEGEIFEIGSAGVRLKNSNFGANLIAWKFDGIEFIEFLDKNGKICNLFISCKYCNCDIEINPIDAKKVDGYSNICEKCKKINMEKCTECGQTFLKERFKTSKKGERLCSFCYSLKYFLCSACNKEFSKDELEGMFNGKNYCVECWDLRFKYCEICERPYYLEDLQYNEEFSVWHCLDCRPQLKIIKNYHYKPSKWKYLKEKWEYPLYMGVELEVEPFIYDENIQKVACEFKNFLKSELLENFIYFKTDSSIHGFEIVTHPFTLQYAHNHIKWNRVLEWLIEKNYTSFKNGRCGLHIHLDKSYFSDTDIIKMRTFFSGASNEIFKFSRREGKDNQYCIYEPFNKSRFLNFAQNGRHCAFNINTNKNTVEVRVFKGTLNINRFIASLQFCDALANFVKISSWAFFINNVSCEKLLWSEFIDFAKRASIYNHFINYVNLIESGRINEEREI